MKFVIGTKNLSISPAEALEIVLANRHVRSRSYPVEIREIRGGVAIWANGNSRERDDMASEVRAADARARAKSAAPTPATERQLAYIRDLIADDPAIGITALPENLSKSAASEMIDRILGGAY